MGLRKTPELPKYLLYATIHFNKYRCFHVLEEEKEVGGRRQDAKRTGQRTPGSPVGATRKLGKKANVWGEFPMERSLWEEGGNGDKLQSHENSCKSGITVEIKCKCV